MNPHLHYPGSKKRIAPWIIQHMPDHHSYLEPFFGGGAVLFEKEPSKIETVNDIDGEVVNFFRVIQNPKSREELCGLVAYTPYSREVYDQAFHQEENSVSKTAAFAIRSMQSHGFRISEKCGWKKDVYGREAAYAVRYWNRLPEALQYIGRRLKTVQIENRPAMELIRAFNHENVLIYCDPPYVLSTRSRRQYRFEMTDDDHEALLQELRKSRAKVMLSGYENSLYDRYLNGWRKEQIAARAQNTGLRVETLWMNY